VKVYTDVAVAAAEARAWLQEKFPHPCGQFELLESHDPHEGMEELADSEDIGRYLDRELAELDERSGYLICKSIKNIGLREFLYWPDEDDWEITGVSDEGKSDSFTDRLAGCRLPHREGVAVFYNNGPTKDDDFLLAVVKRSMYEQMGEHLEDTLQPSRYFGEGGQGDRTCLIIPAVFVTDKRQSHAEFIVDELRDELGLDKQTISKLRQLDCNTLCRLDHEFIIPALRPFTLHPSILKHHNQREAPKRVLGRIGELLDNAMVVTSRSSAKQSRPKSQSNAPTASKFNCSDPRPCPNSKRIGRNDPCPCKSGKKFKYCCLKA
jgi:hypothetical protein